MKIQDALDLHLKEEASRIIGELLWVLVDGLRLVMRVGSPHSVSKWLAYPSQFVETRQRAYL